MCYSLKRNRRCGRLAAQRGVVGVVARVVKRTYERPRKRLQHFAELTPSPIRGYQECTIGDSPNLLARFGGGARESLGLFGFELAATIDVSARGLNERRFNTSNANKVKQQDHTSSGQATRSMRATSAKSRGGVVMLPRSKTADVARSAGAITLRSTRVSAMRTNDTARRTPRPCDRPSAAACCRR